MRRKTFIVSALAAAFASCGVAVAQSPAVTLVHVHGLAFSADGSKLFVPSHQGLAVYEDGKWSKASGPAHDYMGFSGTRSALYSSGHPAPGSNLVNPFGLLKSQDGGHTWARLGLEGESDFHTMAAGHGTNAVYVLNAQPNSRMKTKGIYVTQDDGTTWKAAAAQGLSGQVNALAAHPTLPSTMAAATDSGLFLSRDAGTSFKRVSTQRAFTAWFDLDGQKLWFSGFEGRPTLATMGLADGARAQSMALPKMGEDAIAYIAQNPVRPREMALASFKRNVFLSKDAGKSWSQIAREGAT